MLAAAGIVTGATPLGSSHRLSGGAGPSDVEPKAEGTAQLPAPESLENPPKGRNAASGQAPNLADNSNIEAADDETAMGRVDNVQV